MRKFLFLLVWILFSVSSLLSAQPPIEVIYFKPSDVQSDETDSIREVMEAVHHFYGSEMERHGFGRKSFKFDTDIRIIAGKRTTAEYPDIDTVKNEFHSVDFDTQNKIEIVFLAGRKRILGGALGAYLPICWTWPGQPKDMNDCNHLIVIPTGYKEFLLPVVAHEIAHAFGLHHTHKKLTDSRIDIMYATPTFTEGVKSELDDFAISRKDAETLNESGRLSIQETDVKIDADVNDDGYVDLYDCLIVRSGMQNSVSYDTDINNDGVTDEIDLLIVKAKAMEAIIAAAPRKRTIRLTTWAAVKHR